MVSYLGLMTAAAQLAGAYASFQPMFDVLYSDLNQQKIAHCRSADTRSIVDPTISDSNNAAPFLKSAAVQVESALLEGDRWVHAVSRVITKVVEPPPSLEDVSRCAIGAFTTIRPVFLACNH